MKSFIALILILSSSAKGKSLASYNVDSSAITISGVSSGAFMAVQMQVAYSRLFAGVGSIAGGIFWCAKGDSKLSKTQCMDKPESSDVSEQLAEAERLARAGQIDLLENLKMHRIYLFASPTDSVVNQVQAERLVEFYKPFIPNENVIVENGLASAHGFPTLNSGMPCKYVGVPWILNCNFDTAGKILEVMYGDLAPRGKSVAAHLLKFYQRDFGNASTPLFRSGWVYVPGPCAKGAKCKLHVALHGCLMNPNYVQDQFATSAGYNEWAETNGIIVLYPQSAQLGQTNPYACWDWFGFTGANYATQGGAQMLALKKMVDRLRGL